MALVGRDEELARVRAFLGGVGELPRALLLEGEAGIGKTVLWREGLEAAARESFRILRAEAAASEAELAFTLLGDLLGGDVAGVLGDLPGPQRRALEVALLFEDPGSARPESRTIGMAVARVLGLLARERPLLVAIDDVQWIDAASRAALEFALRRIRLEPVVLFLTRRGGPGDAPPLGLSRVMADDAFARLAVGPLSLGALSELLRSRLGFGCPRPTLRRIAEESGGNPFFALEFASALQRRGVRIEPGEPLPVPVTLRDLVADRVAALPARSREALLVAALAFEPTVELVGRALEGDPWERLGPAVRADAIELQGGVVRFTHPLVTSVVRASAEGRGRGDAHRLLAGVVAAGEERAWHLALSTAGVDGEIARVVSEAAALAAARGAPAAAACLLEHAWRLTPGGGGEGGERRLAAARLHFTAGDARRAEQLLHQALGEAPAGLVRARVLYELAGVERETRGVRQGMARYYEALREAEDAELQASIHRELASILRFTRDVETAREHAEAAVASAHRVGDRRVLADALSFAALVRFNGGEPGSLALAEEAIAVAAAGAAPGYEPRHALAHHLMWSGRFAAARRVLEELRQALSARGGVSEIDVLWYLAQLELRAGDWARAGEYADALQELVLQSGREDQERTALWPKALVAAHRGELEAATAMAQRGLALSETSGALTGQVIHRGVLGFVELSRGDFGKARAYFDAADEVFGTLGIREPGMTFVLSGRADAIEALIALGAHAPASGLLGPWEQRARSLDRPWPLSAALRCRGLLLAAENNLEHGLGAFEQALLHHRRAEDPFQYARTLLALGITQRRAKQRGAARASLEHALVTFERLGAPLWVEKTRAELGRIGGRAPSGGELTATEQRLAELVSEGHSNKEIAARLFLTPKTVGTKLSRIYAKLGVRSRTELAHVLAERRASKV